ncbi:MAG: hypothetical protein AB1896_19840, partial [Thermodesulfobacteriota bacterium]
DLHLDFFLGVWLASSFLVFSLAATKQPNYVLPSVPPLLLLAARWWEGRLSGGGDHRGLVLVLAGLTALIGLILGLFFVLAPRLAPQALETARAGINPDSFEYALPAGPPELGYAALLPGLLVLAAVSAFLVLAHLRRTRGALAALIAGGLCFSLGFTHLTAPRVLAYLQTPAKELAVRLDRTMEKDERLAAYGLYKPTLWFYSGRRIERVRSDDQAGLADLLAGPGRVYVLSRLNLLETLESTPGFRLLETRGGYVLGDNREGRP